MKQIYESEVLFQLMERDGFNIPSSVPPYEAEIKAYLINQVKLAYPKLTDYEAEWLLYNYTKHLPADFPISSVSDVTTATFENVVPFAYQSAILNGNTLVNLGVNTNGKLLTPTDINYDVNCSYLEVGKTYYVIVKTNSTSETGVRCGFVNNAGTSWDDSNNYVEYSNNKLVAKKLTLVKNKDSKFRIQLKGANSSTPSEVNNLIEYVLILEYQQGMENWDIPYFEGMQSVKMPVLTTTGKNLFDIDTMVSKYATVENGVVIKTGYVGHTAEMLKITNLKIGKTYTLSCDYLYDGTSNGSILVYCLTYDSGDYNSSKDNIKISVSNTKRINETFVAKKDVVYLIGSVWQTYISNIQIEEGSTATPYEPHKSNILTVNEEVELRGVGDVKDELDCLTGEVKQRIGEIKTNNIINEITITKRYTDKLIIRLPLTLKTTTYPSNLSCPYLLCDKLKTLSFKHAYTDNTEIGVYVHDTNTDYIYMCILNSNLVSNDLDGIKEYLKANPSTIQYKLLESTVKTVDLNVVNEKGEKVRIKAEDLLAVVFSHEIDHLDGILFVDKAEEIYDATEEEE